MSTLSSSSCIGIKPYLDIEQDTVFASYDMLKDEYIKIDIDPKKKLGTTFFSNDMREIEEFDFRILNYTFVKVSSTIHWRSERISN